MAEGQGRLPRELWMQQQYWEEVRKRGGAVPEDPLASTAAPPLAPPSSEGWSQAAERSKPRKEFQKLVEEELEELQLNSSLPRSERILKMGILDLMLASRPAVRKEGLKMYLQAHAAETEAAARASSRSKVDELRAKAHAQAPQNRPTVQVGPVSDGSPARPAQSSSRGTVGTFSSPNR